MSAVLDFKRVCDGIDNFGAMLRAARESVGMSRAAFAAATGIEWRSLWRWEDRGVLPNADQRARIIAALAANR